MVKKFVTNCVKLIQSGATLRGSGSMYVLVILGLVSGLSFLLTGGLVPQIEKHPENPEFVEIEVDLTPVAQQNLQMRNIKVKPTSTPTPTPTVAPSVTLSPTIRASLTPTRIATTPPAACLNNTAIDILLDLSNSMNTSSKINALRNALGSFSDQLENNTVLGVQAFAGPASMPPNGTKRILPFSKVGSNRSSIRNTLTSISPSTVSPDGTYMRNGFEYAVSQIENAKNTYPDYRFVTIVFSDGVPETQYAADSPCEYVYNPPPGSPNYLCFARDQDPRISPSQVQAMKNEVDKVYSVAIYNHSPSSRDGQAQDQLNELMQNIASGRNAPYYQDANTTDPEELTAFFDQIISGICP